MLIEHLNGKRREIRGIGFVEFADPRDAEDAQRGLDLMYLEGREVCHLRSDSHEHVVVALL
jgi:hypothetical protein